MSQHLTETSLPTFAGRRRDTDVGFFPLQNFSEFLKTAESIMEDQECSTDAQKINILQLLADKNKGDFNGIMAQLRTHVDLKKFNYAETIEYLRPIYSPISEQSLLDSTSAFTEFAQKHIKNRELVSQYVTEFHKRFESVLTFFKRNNPVPNPIRRIGDTDEEYLEKIQSYADGCMRELSLRLFLGPQMTPSVHKTTFAVPQGCKRPYQSSVVQLYTTVGECPRASKCFIHENKDQIETETLKVDTKDGIDKPQEVDAFYASNRGSYNRGNNHNTYNRGRSNPRQRGNWNYNNRQNYQGQNYRENYYNQQGNFNQHSQFTDKLENKFLKGIFCFHCQREGHMARHCRSLNQGQRGQRGYHRGTNQQMRRE